MSNTFEAGSFKAIIVGECGDGKSTIIKAVLEHFGADYDKDKLVCDTKSKGVTKDINKYKFTMRDGRTAYLLDTPGVGDATVKIAVLIESISEILNGVKVDALVMCNAMTKRRVTLGAQIVSGMIKAGIVEKGHGGCHDNIILVGTQLDLYTATCKSEKKKTKEIKKWDDEMPADVNERCGFKPPATVRYVHTACYIDEDEPADSEINISEFLTVMEAVAKKRTQVKFDKIAPEVLVKNLSETTGLDLADGKAVKKMEGELVQARKEIEAARNSFWKTFLPVAGGLFGPIGASIGYGISTAI